MFFSVSSPHGIFTAGGALVPTQEKKKRFQCLGRAYSVKHMVLNNINKTISNQHSRTAKNPPIKPRPLAPTNLGKVKALL